MSRRKIWIIGLAALLLVLAVALGYTLTRQPETPAEEAAAAEEARETTQDACASRETFEGLKQLVFDRAGQLRTSDDTANFAVLAETAFVRMERPVVEARDESLDLTACSGRFILELPPGAEQAFGGERRMAAMVTYEVQSAADGSGPVYRMNGTEVIILRLAAFELQGERLEMFEEPVPVDPLTNGFEPIPETSLPDTDGAAPVPIPAFPGPPAPARPAPPERFSNPSFDCKDASTRSELMVCGSQRLARADRRMASIYEDAVAAADPRTQRELRRTRDAFLAYRDRCSSEACVAEAYDGRVAEIRDIMAARGY